MSQTAFNLVFGSIVRSLIMLLAGWLAQRGLLAGDATEWVGAVTLALLGLAWSIYQKYVERSKFLTALSVPQGSTEAHVAAKLDVGAGITGLAVFK